jgi:hypothetical protein
MLARLTLLVIPALVIWGSYCYVGYFLERSSFALLCLVWFGGSIMCYWWVHNNRFSLSHGLWLAAIIRASLFFVTPELSQDFYRYLWDGQLLHLGVNPYQYTPSQWMHQWGASQIPHAETLIEGMGELSASNHSNYPPLHQFAFYISTLFGNSLLSGIIGLRLFVILGDLMVCYFGIKILHFLKLPKKRILWYVLNPLIILELYANLHLEGLMLGLFLLGIYGLFKSQTITPILGIAGAISLKLLPLLTLPVIFRYNNQPLKNAWLILGVIVISCLSFTPFISVEMFTNYSNTLGLWFTNFEFNGSIYYIVRSIGSDWLGYNPIRTVGKILPLVSFFILLILWIKHPLRQQHHFFDLITMSFCLYLFFSTTIHPWYLVLPLGMSLFGKYRFPWVWSTLIVFSYSAYGASGFKENMLLITIEYILVYGFLFWEVFLKRKIQASKAWSGC